MRGCGRRDQQARAWGGLESVVAGLFPSAAMRTVLTRDGVAFPRAVADGQPFHVVSLHFVGGWGGVNRDLYSWGIVT